MIVGLKSESKATLQNNLSGEIVEIINTNTIILDVWVLVKI